MKVAFYLENSFLKDVDFREVLNGNPGVGGSEYMIAIIATMLSLRENGIDVVLYVQKEGLFDKGICTRVALDLRKCIDSCNECGVDYLFFKHDMCHIDSGVLESSPRTGLVPWCHNFAPNKALDYYVGNRNISRILCVGREQMDLYRDHRAFGKSDYIYNCISEHSLVSRNVEDYPYSKRPNRVTYIGSIGYQKGLHWLAEAWPTVLKEVPDAELYIIGSGKLYSRDFTLGKWCIADKDYEEMFMPFLTDEQGILPSVHFMGIMGEEKNEILLQTKVGVPNPSGFSETFGIGAVEMQAMGCRIATMRCAGYLDTVRNGILYDRKSELADAIIKQLKMNKNDYDSAKEFILTNFSQEVVVKDWEQFILHALPDNVPLHPISNLNMDFEHKASKERVRKIKNSLPLLYSIMPSVEFCFRVVDKVKGVKRSHPHRNIGI